MAIRWGGHLLAVVGVTFLAGCSKPPAIDLLAAEPVSLNELRGRWVFVNYWAEWCKPCAEEIPELNEFARDHADQVMVLGVNYDGAAGAELERQARSLNIDFAVAEQDPAALLGLPRPTGLPTTFVLDREGHYRAALLGPQTRKTLLAALNREPSGGNGGD